MGARAEANDGFLCFVAGMNLPSALGRVNASWPLALLRVGQQAMEFRPRWFAKLLMKPVVIRYVDVSADFPVRGRLTAGVGLQLRDGEAVYFWTNREQVRLLEALGGLGVVVDPQPRPPRLWRTRPGGPQSSLGFGVFCQCGSCT
jgi:hypothetical protein